MKNVLYAMLLALMFLACVLFYPRFAFGQGIKGDLVRFSTGGGQKIETIFSARGSKMRSEERVALQFAGSLLLIADTFQTLDASRHSNGENFENNVILGGSPSDGKVYLYMGSALVVYNVGARILREVSEPLCTAWLQGWVTVQVGTVASNLQKGWDGL